MQSYLLTEYYFAKLAALTQDMSAGEIAEIIKRVNRSNFLTAKQNKTEPQPLTQRQITDAIDWAKRSKA